MIPLKLQIKNFLSYGSPTQTIDFEPYHLICLSGKNGHGKSALLDAITWALWGQARKIGGSSKADEGLIRLGQTNMLVSIDFSCNGTYYRVRREFTYDRGKGVAQLDFGIIDNGRLRPLTDKTIRATQAAIEKTIGLDFDSFVNSVFLRQGNSNEFSKKSPKERKEIIATILGLARYELLRKRALEKVRDGGITSSHLKSLCDRLVAGTAKAPELEAEQAKLELTYAQLIEEEAAQLQAQQALLQEQKVAAHTSSEYQKQLFIYEQLRSQQEEHTQKLKALASQWRTIHRQQRARAHVVYNEARMQELRGMLDTLQKETQEQLERTLKQQEALSRCHALEKELAQALNTQAHHKRTIEEQQKEQSRLEALQKALVVQKQLVAVQEKQLKELTALFERRKSMYHTFAARGKELTHQLQETTRKKELATATDNPSCALCEQELSQTRRRELLARLVGHEKLVHHQLARLKRVVPALKELLVTQHQELVAAQQRITLLQAEVAQEGRHQTELEALKAAHTQTAAAMKEIENTRALVEAQLTKAQESHASLATAPATHSKAQYDTVKQEYTLLEEARQAHLSRAAQQAEQAQRTREVHGLCQTIRQLRAQAQTQQQALAPYKEVLERQKIVESEAAKITNALQQLGKEKERIAHQKGSVEMASKRIKEEQAQLQEEQKKLEGIHTDIENYQTIAQALSKDGIQGLLIEHVLPELEAEANHLLSKLTNNQAHLMIESMRDLKSGGTKETLDIKISDAVGIRPYELFSGGEAFRIDFALRLAISKLLARRAGTSLQTLIIDEGFGSQDEEGLGYIMESLYAIQHEFAKIIIVSHLPSMKEQFPTHFYVSKGPRGSAVQVIEQG